MNAVSLILYVAAAFAGVFILTRLLVRALKLALLIAFVVFVASWIRFSHTPLCSSQWQQHLPSWATPICKDSDLSQN